MPQFWEQDICQDCEKLEQRIAELERQLAECQQKAEALDWLEESQIALLIGVESDGKWSARIATEDYEVHSAFGATALEAIQNLRKLVEDEP